MIETLLPYIFILGVGVTVGWMIGWEAACRLYRDRAIERAEQQYEQDRRKVL